MVPRPVNADVVISIFLNIKPANLPLSFLEIQFHKHTHISIYLDLQHTLLIHYHKHTHTHIYLKEFSFHQAPGGHTTSDRENSPAITITHISTSAATTFSSLKTSFGTRSIKPVRVSTIFIINEWQLRVCAGNNGPMAVAILVTNDIRMFVRTVDGDF